MELAVLLALLGAAQALSTCRSLDLEAARRKRIEAVRGQILSKLRLPAPPAETPARQLPEDVRALYNSTRELLRQQARLRPPDGPDGYWAKELHRFPMEPPADGESWPGGGPSGGPPMATSPGPCWGDGEGAPVPCI
ncbi:TGFB1 factor, partial [Anseranas semipalmata]|nr:TGFB1 factor [Anseranas semipalmata]